MFFVLILLYPIHQKQRKNLGFGCYCPPCFPGVFGGKIKQLSNPTTLLMMQCQIKLLGFKQGKIGKSMFTEIKLWKTCILISLLLNCNSTMGERQHLDQIWGRGHERYSIATTCTGTHFVFTPQKLLFQFPTEHRTQTSRMKRLNSVSPLECGWGRERQEHRIPVA